MSEVVVTAIGVRDRWTVIFLAAGFGLALSLSLLPSTFALSTALLRQIPDIATHPELFSRALFPIVAAIFYLSGFGSRRRLPKLDFESRWWLSLPIPFFIAVVFGLTLPYPNTCNHERQLQLLWYLICVPVGEELLFRGWAVDLAEKIFPAKLFSETNPVPVSYWVSAILFSLWHVQNIGAWPLALVLFQMTYTFFLGFWFCHLRAVTHTLAAPMLAHALVNAAAFGGWNLC